MLLSVFPSFPRSHRWRALPHAWIGVAANIRYTHKPEIFMSASGEGMRLKGREGNEEQGKGREWEGAGKGREGSNEGKGSEGSKEEKGREGKVTGRKRKEGK